MSSDFFTMLSNVFGCQMEVLEIIIVNKHLHIKLGSLCLEF